MSQYQSFSQRTQGGTSNVGGNQSRIPTINTTSSVIVSHSGNYQNQAIQEALLKWSRVGEGQGDVIVHGQSDVALLKNLRNILLGLQTQFTEGGSKVIFTGDKRDDFNKRLILLENEIEGLLKRKIEYSARDEIGGTRVLDYSGLLNQKQTQIVELQKKINNFQERLRRATARELELQNHITQLYADLKRKQSIILAKNEVILAEVASSNALRESLNRVKRNIETNRSRIGDLERTILEGVTFPDVGSFEIKGDILTKDGALSRSKGYQNQTQSQKSKTQIIQLFREFERLNNQDGISDSDAERILEGFLVGFNGSRIKQSVDLSITRRKQEEDYLRLREQFGVAVGIFQGFIDRIKRENASLRVDVDPRIFDILKDHKISIYKTAGDFVNLDRFTERTVEVPVQDARTKHLIHLLAVQMKQFCSKYPKLSEQMDSRLTEFFQQELIDVIQTDQMDRLVSIVKYVPEVVTVQNVYAYSNEKSRKVEFHLRVLVKALLQQLEKIRRKTGVVLEIDEGIIGMINQQIMGVVDVDDILKVFRVVPKIVEVEKIVEKIVDRIVEVPQVVPVETIKQKIVEVEKIRQVDRIINVPLQVPTIISNVVEKVVPVERTIEKIVEVPQIVERIVEVIKQVPKVQIVDRIEQRPVEVEKVIQVEKIVNHIETRVEQIEVVVQKIVQTERVIEIIKQVPVIVEKIVQRIVEIPKVIEVEKLVEVIIPQKQVVVAQQIDNHIEVRYQIVDRIIQKPVPIIQTVERIVQVPQIVEKIVTVERVIENIREVQRIVEKIVVQDRIQQVVREVKIPVQVIREIPREIERIVEIPVIHERLITVQQIVEKPVVQRIQNTIIKQVYLRDPIIVRQPQKIEVERIVNHYIDVPKPIKYIEEKVVEVVKYVDRIKEIKVPVEKVIEKLVEVPKVVEVEKIVEKVVVVPRVVEKIVEVPQIVERVVPKIIIEEKIVEVERIVQVPMIQEKIVEVEVPQNVFIEVEKVVEKIVDKLVQVPRYEEKIINNEVIVEKIIEVIKEVPRNIEVEKIVHLTVQSAQIVEVERQIIVPVQVPIPTEKIVEKIVPITEIVQKIVQVPQVIEKVVTVKEEVVQIKEIPRIQEKIVNNVQYKEIVREVPYITEKIKEVDRVVEKIVPVQSVVQEIVTAQQIVQKIIEKTNTIPKVYEVERRNDVIIEIPKIIEIEKIIPQIVNVNRYIQNIVEKIVQVPVIVEQIKEVVRENQKIVEVRNEYETVKEVETIVQKAVIVEKFKQVVKNINHIEKVLQIVDRFEKIPVEVLIQQERLVEVPYILEKIVEKIVLMPQVHEVVKYIHEITEKDNLGIAVGVEVSTYEQKLKILSRDIKVNFDILLVELRKLLKSNPNLKLQIEVIERFLAQFEQYLLYPKIFPVPTEKIVEKIVEKDRIVSVPTQDERSVKMQLTLSLLVEKLILELKRLRKDNPSLNLQLEDDVKLIFFTELDQGSNLVSGDFNNKLKSFSDSIYRKFESLGSWSVDHQMMLNSFLQERFLMANLVKNANLEIEKSRTISSKSSEAIARYQSEIGLLQGYIGKIRSSLQGGLNTEQQSILGNILREFDVYVTTRIVGEPVKMLGDLAVNDARVQSLIRQKDEQILRLRDRLFGLEKSKVSSSSHDQSNRIIQVLREQNLKLKNNMSVLQSERGSIEIITSLKQEILDLQRRNLQLEQENSNLNTELLNNKRQYEVRLQVYGENAKISTITAGDSALRSPNMRSPVQQYNMKSPDYTTKLVDSQMKTVGGDQTSKLGDTSRSYRLADSSHSGTSATRQGEISRPGTTSLSGSDIYQSGYSQSGSSSIQQPVGGSTSTTSRYQSGSTGATGGNTGISGSGAYQSGSGATYQNISGTGSSYQGGTGATYQSGTGASYQSGSGSGAYQTGTSYQAGGSGAYQTGQSGSVSSSYQSGTGSSFQSGTSGYSGYQSGTGFTSGYGGATGTGGAYTTSTFRTGTGTGYGTTTQQGGQSGQSGQTGQSGQSGQSSTGTGLSRFGTSNYSSYRGTGGNN